MKVYSVYCNWCNASGLISVGVPKFREQLEERQIVIKRKRPKDKTISTTLLNMILGFKLKEK